MEAKEQDEFGQTIGIRAPLSPESRMNSVSSISPHHQASKEALSQALDKIHSSASQTSTLTTFNDFAAPPPSTSASNDRSFPNQIVQGGVGGLYGRLKASVGASREYGIDPTQNRDADILGIHSKKAYESETSSIASPLVASISSHQQVQSKDSISVDLDPQESELQPHSTLKTSQGVDLTPPEDPLLAHTTLLMPQTIIAQDRLPKSTSNANDEMSPKPAGSFLESNDGGKRSSNASPSPVTADFHDSDRQRFPNPVAPLSAQTRQSNDLSTTMQTTVSSADTSEGFQFPPNLDSASRRKSFEPQLDSNYERSATTDYDAYRLKTRPSQNKTHQQPPRLHPGLLNTEGLSEFQPVRTYPYPRSDSTPDSATPSRPLTRNGRFDKPESPDRASSPTKATRDLKKQLISKDFWMKDENAKVCFLCGDGFSTFRRKHHCSRVFAQSGTIRVCKTCQTIATAENDSSDESGDDEFLSNSLVRQIRFTGGAAESDGPISSLIPGFRSSSGFGPDADAAESPKPTAAKRRSLAIFGSDNTIGLSRPNSSRSLKSLAGRPRNSSQKHQPSHLHQHTAHFHHLRSLRAGQDDGAPFRRSNYSDQANSSSLPAFHTDIIIDPDLAPFLSDEGSTDGEPDSLNAKLQGDVQDQFSTGLGNLFAGMRRTRSHANSRSGHLPGPTSRDTDAISISSSHVGRLRRPRKSRTLSMSSIGPYGPSLRLKRSDNLFAPGIAWPNFWRRSNVIDEPIASTNNFAETENIAAHDTLQKTAGELNATSLQHVRYLLRQSLYDAKIENVSRWEKVLMPILIKCAENLDPSLQRNDSIDIRQYIKLKKAPGGRPNDTQYISGVTFTGNVALKRMPRSISNARLLLVSFPIMYARQQQHFTSLEPIIAQEREYLRKLVNRILTLQPDVLFVQQSISGLALEFLQEADVAVVCNVKESVMHAISRCARTRIISSVDKLAMNPTFLGYCSTFEAKTLMSQEYKKSYIFISGCQRDLGCTIVLRGASTRTLRSLKTITEFMCFVAYNLKLETCLLRDQFVSSPLSEGHSYPRHRQSSLLELARMPAQISRAILNFDADQENEKPELEQPNEHKYGEAKGDCVALDTEISQSHLKPAHARKDGCKELHSYEDLLGELKSRILSVSPSVRFEEPYLLQRGQEQESQLLHLRKLQSRDNIDKDASNEETEQPQFELVQPEMVYDTTQSGSQQVREVIRAIHDAEYERTLHRYNTLRRRWEIYLTNTVEPFSPFSHQRIVVLFSVVSSPSLNACAGPDLLAIEFYQEQRYDNRLEPDMPLGEYVESLCMQAERPCITGRCDQPMLNHSRQYVHGEGQISISIERQPPKLRGLQDIILMWSCCKICEQETQVTPMSSNSWKYSFGKYLELSFWSQPLYPRAGLCPHDINRDHDRFFGFRDLVLRIRYAPINLMEVIVPRATITWRVDKDLQLKNAQYKKIEDRIVRFMSSVKDRLASINVENVSSENVEECRAEVGNLSQKADADLEWLKMKLQEKYMTSKFYENIPLNRAVRAMQEKVAEWDTAFNDFEHTFLPSDQDLTAMVAQQLKKMYLNREESSTSITSNESHLMSEKLEGFRNDKLIIVDMPDSKDDSSQLTRDSGHNSATSEAQDHVLSLSDPALSVSCESSVAATTDERRSSLVQQLDLAASAQALDASNMAKPLSSVEDQRLEGAISLTTNNDTQASRRSAQFDPLLDAELKAGMDNAGQEALGGNNSSSRNKTAQSTVGGNRPAVKPLSPTLIRSKTQPEGLLRQDVKKSIQSTLGLKMTPIVPPTPPVITEAGQTSSGSIENDLLHKISVNALKWTKSSKNSMIPRAVSTKKGESKVSSLAMHFERLSREFEKERLRERRHKFTRNRLRAFPTASSKPVVEVYRDAHEAVRERGPSGEDLSNPHEAERVAPKDDQFSETGVGRDSHEVSSFVNQAEDENATEASNFPPSDENFAEGSYAASEVEGATSETEMHDSTDGEERPILTSADSNIDLELPKHERGTLMKMLSSFWSERSASGWSPLEYPMVPTDHVFADSDVIVREDEPSSLIAFSLASQDYLTKLQKFRDRIKGPDKNQAGQRIRSTDPEDPEVEDILLGETATHLKYQFHDAQAIMHCKIFYSESFDAIRRKCGVTERFVESLSRCLKWDSKGGKTKSLFLKTLDERFVLKSLSQVEVQAFLKFAPDYFHYMSETLFHSLPSAIAKILGFYQVVIRNPVTGIAFNHFLQVMENVFYEGPSNRMFDLKGSMRNRKIESTGEENEVLLDENLLDYVSQSPVYVRNHSNAILAQSIQNDTLFCSKQNVMDYSLVVGLYNDRKELVVGVIDYIRTYTWDKKLESMIKDRGKHKATVREPRKYRARFRESIARYFPLAPSCWHVLPSQRTELAQTQARLMAREDDGLADRAGDPDPDDEAE